MKHQIFLFANVTEEDKGKATDIVILEGDLSIIGFGRLVSMENLACQVQLQYIANTDSDVWRPESEVNLIKKYVKVPRSTQTETDGKFIFYVLNLSQFNCSAAGPGGSSACMGISVSLAERFLDCNKRFFYK